MTLEELITEGLDLEAKLYLAANLYHEKDDHRDILEYEAATVNAYTLFIQDGTPVREEIKKSSLLGPWGKNYQWKEIQLIKRTEAFHDSLSVLLGTSTKGT